MIQEVFIIDDDDSSILVFKELFKEDQEYKFVSVKSNEIEKALRNIPSIIIINEDAVEVDVVSLCRRIREDEDNGITPIIVVSSNKDKNHRVELLKSSIEYYIKKPVNEKFIYYTIKNLCRLLMINRRVSPLTGLPGNVQIHAELKKRLSSKKPFSVLYIDLDNFKAYNDIYGFLKGDEIIKYTANVITRCTHNLKNEGSFVGHIGGDDFVSIIDGTQGEELCKSIIANFDANVSDFYTEQDMKKGYIEVENRKGIIEHFPITSLSIGVVESDIDRFSNILEIGEVGAQVKHLAKTVPGSTYVVDRRR